MEVLATGLATVGQADGLRELYFVCCRFIGRAESGGLMGAPEHLAAGLASNTTLKKLCLCHVGAVLDDASLASIVGALSNHPTLEALELERCECGRNTMHSIHRWLRSDGCRPRELEIEWPHGSDDQSESSGQSELTLNVLPLFLQVLPQNNSLETLTISYSDIDEKDVNLLLGNLWKLPKLRSLDVSGNRIADIVSLTENLAGTMPAHRLRKLNFRGQTMAVWEDYNDSTEESILHLLKVFPELGFLGGKFERAIQLGKIPSSVVVLRLDRNRCFGLLQGGATIPLSVWPVVMGKANEDTYDIQMDPSRKATII